MRSFDIAAVLNREGIEYETRDNSLRIRCPFHDDSTPSCDISQQKLQFICRSCQAQGGVVKLLSKLTNKPRHLVLASLKLSNDKPVDPAAIKRYSEKIWSATSLLSELAKRGVSRDTILRFHLGEHQGRITIPITNANGMFTNIRAYLPGAAENKTVNLKGRGVQRLYPFEQLAYDRILITGGEVKALAGLQRLNEHGIGCVTLTSGETQWSDEFDDYFEDKQVWVGLDIDDPGRRAAEFRCRRLSTVANWVGMVEWPLDKKKYPHGDLNDYVMQPDANLLALLEATPVYEFERGKAALAPEQTKPIDVPIRAAYSAKMVDKRFCSTALILANGQDAYFLPKVVVPECDQRQECCPSCPIYGTMPGQELIVPAEGEVILAMMDSPLTTNTTLLRESMKIPDCPVVRFEIKEKYEVRESRVQQALDLSAQDLDSEAVPAVMVGTTCELNETYRLTGKTVSHPKTQKGVAIVSHSEQVADALKDFRLKSPEDMLRFRPEEWSIEGIDALLDPFYKEMSHNATMIYERPTLHQLVDLTYHSVLTIPVGNNTQRGWVETLACGDSSQGKSLTSIRMADFYQLGEKVDCKNASVAGLVGGLEQVNGKWFVQWGVLPRHDRRLVILEELKGLKTEVFAKLTEVRSSGRAEIPKIIRRIAPARCRLVVNSNPRKHGLISDYSYGVYALMELIGSPEDLRRFDACMIISKADVTSVGVNEMRPHLDPTFSAEQCRRLILWCWTRPVDKVIFTPEANERIVKASNDLCDTFVDDMPLLERAGTKYKLMRLSAALAGRTFSSCDEHEKLIIHKAHVDWIERFLRKEYTREANGYAAMSASIKRKSALHDQDVLAAALKAMPYADVMVDRMLSTDEIDHQDISDWCGWTKDEAALLISKMVRCNALKRHDRMYRKTPAFAEFLRGLDVKRPAHIETINEY